MKLKILTPLIFIGFCTANIPAQEKLTPALWKRIEAESPKPLPQSPVVNRETTDAQDDGLKGKIRRVISEYRSYTDVYAGRGKVLSHIDDYDLSGYQLRSVSFANGGEFVGVQVYGYIGGFRVSFYKAVGGSSGLWTVVGAPPPKPNPPTQSPDKRYTYRYEHSYNGGKLTFMRMFNNDGSRGMYYKYAASLTERSTSAFTYDDRPSWKAIYKLDEKGDEIEEVDVDVRKVYGYDTVYRIENKAFDQAGNWTRRSRYQVNSKNGKASEVLISDEFRTITYH